MRLQQHLIEMAAPRIEDIAKTYYHGTSTDQAGNSILKKGINPPDLSIGKKNQLTPVMGKVYITPNLEYALIYALGANAVGSDWPRESRPNEEFMWLFVLDGKQLSDIQPDEDSIGELVYKKSVEWLNRMATLELTTRQHEKVMDGEYAYWASTGKKLLKKMSDSQKLNLLDNGAHIAHTGPLTPHHAYQLPKSENHKLKKNGSNFFTLAKKLK